MLSKKQLYPREKYGKVTVPSRVYKSISSFHVLMYSCILMKMLNCNFLNYAAVHDFHNANFKIFSFYCMKQFFMLISISQLLWYLKFNIKHNKSKFPRLMNGTKGVHKSNSSCPWCHTLCMKRFNIQTVIIFKVNISKQETWNIQENGVHDFGNSQIFMGFFPRNVYTLKTLIKQHRNIVQDNDECE
jgi:hypothetical protein